MQVASDGWMAEEQLLLRRAQQGDRQAFCVLCEPLEKRLYSAAYRVTGQREDAADALQEGLIKAYRRIGQFQGESAFATWLYRIVINASLDLVRRRRARREVLVDVGETQTSRPLWAARQTGGPQMALETAEVRCTIAEALAAIPPIYRAVLTLRYVQGFSTEEVAEILSLPVGTVKSRLFRACRLLRPYLEGSLTPELPAAVGQG